MDFPLSATEGDLCVWWIAQVPGPKFIVPVVNVAEAKLLLVTLAKYDAFQFKNRIKPDYCNSGGLCVFENGEWVDWYDEDGNDIDSIIRTVSLDDLRAMGQRVKGE